MFTKFAVAAVALVAAVAMTAPAEAKTHVSIGLGLGFGGGYGGYGYGGPYDDDYYYPAYGGSYGGISCGRARSIVRSNGFYNVVATDCEGDIMRFQGKRYGDWYRIKVNRWGNIVSVRPL